MTSQAEQTSQALLNEYGYLMELMRSRAEPTSPLKEMLNLIKIFEKYNISQTDRERIRESIVRSIGGVK